MGDPMRIGTTVLLRSRGNSRGVGTVTTPPLHPGHRASGHSDTHQPSPPHPALTPLQQQLHLLHPEYCWQPPKPAWLAPLLRLTQPHVGEGTRGRGLQPTPLCSGHDGSPAQGMVGAREAPSPAGAQHPQPGGGGKGWAEG